MISTRRGSLLAHLRTNRWMYILVLPGLAWLLVFRYIPLYGVTMAFQDFTYRLGYLKSPWVGLKHFRYLLGRDAFMDAFWNTWIINLQRIVFGFPVPILLALSMNEVRSSAYKRVVQTISYLPHFISWVVLAGIFNSLLAKNTGAVNHLLAAVGLERISFLQDNHWFRTILIVTEIWKELGWGTIIYLATIAGINPELYESARVDGAGRWRQMLHVTLPSLAPTMIVVFILRLGQVLNLGFEQIFNLYNPLVYETGDIIQTWIVRMLQENPNFSRLAAAGLIRNLIGMVILLAANRAVRLFGREGIY